MSEEEQQPLIEGATGEAGGVISDEERNYTEFLEKAMRSRKMTQYQLLLEAQENRIHDCWWDNISALEDHHLQVDEDIMTVIRYRMGMDQEWLRLLYYADKFTKCRSLRDLPKGDLAPEMPLYREIDWEAYEPTEMSEERSLVLQVSLEGFKKHLEQYSKQIEFVKGLYRVYLEGVLRESLIPDLVGVVVEYL